MFTSLVHLLKYK